MSDSDSTQVDRKVQYRDVEGFPGYIVGDDGSLWSRLKKAPLGHDKGWEARIDGDPRPIKPHLDRHGYPYAEFYRAGQRPKSISLARLVLSTFVGPAPPGMDSCHDPDPTPTNCWVGNLRWDTRKNNLADHTRWCDANGIIRRKTYPNGQECHKAKLTREQVVEIRKMVSEGYANGPIAERFNTTKQNIYAIKTRRNWRHVP